MKFEYKILAIRGSVKAVEELLNKFGQNGWELINIIDNAVVMKRQLIKNIVGEWVYEAN